MSSTMPSPGMFDIPKDFHVFVRRLARELGMLFVMDEVISFAVGYGGYQRKYGLEADLTVFGKIVGGGFPVGAVGGRDDLMDAFDNSKPSNRTTMSGTFSGNNFTLAAGLATMRAMTLEVYEHIERLRARLHKGLVDLFTRANVPFQAVSEGSVLSFYLTDQPRDRLPKLADRRFSLDRAHTAGTSLPGLQSACWSRPHGPLVPDDRGRHRRSSGGLRDSSCGQGLSLS